MAKTRPDRRCPCGSGLDYGACCGLYLDQNWHAPDCLTLMRSRYTAFTTGRSDYLLATWHRDTRPERLDLERSPPGKWLGRKIIAATQDPPVVEFVARRRVGGRAERLHERSRFVYQDGKWLYYDGIQDPDR